MNKAEGPRALWAEVLLLNSFQKGDKTCEVPPREPGRSLGLAHLLSPEDLAAEGKLVPWVSKRAGSHDGVIHMVTVWVGGQRRAWSLLVQTG